MIAALQALPVAGAENALMSSSSTDTLAESGFSQVLADARADAGAAVAGKGGSGKDGSSAADDGNTLPLGLDVENFDSGAARFDLTPKADESPVLDGKLSADAPMDEVDLAAVEGTVGGNLESDPRTLAPSSAPAVAPPLAMLKMLSPQSAPNVLTGGLDLLVGTQPPEAAAAATLPAGVSGVAEDRLGVLRGVSPALGASVQVQEGAPPMAVSDRSLAEDSAPPLLRPPASGSVTADASLSNASSAAVTTTTTTPFDPALSRNPVTLSMNHVPADPEFTGELVNRLSVFARNGGHEATLQLNPADLGRLQVSITTDGDQARVVFVADSAAARDAIEQSLPRLREMLAQSGLQLAQSEVSGQAFGQQRQQASSQNNPAGVPDQANLAASNTVLDIGTEYVVGSVRLVDYYI